MEHFFGVSVKKVPLHEERDFGSASFSSGCFIEGSFERSTDSRRQVFSNLDNRAVEGRDHGPLQFSGNSVNGCVELRARALWEWGPIVLDQILGFVAASLETLLGIFLEVRERPIDAPLHHGKSGWTLRIAGVIEGPASLLLRLLLGGSHSGRYGAAVCFIAGALLNRYGWIWAGRASAENPSALFRLQRKT